MSERPMLIEVSNAGLEAVSQALEAQGQNIDRQMTLDAALADATEVVARQRTRLGRRVCSRSDGATIRRIYELLRAMADMTGGADNDPSFLQKD